MLRTEAVPRGIILYGLWYTKEAKNENWKIRDVHKRLFCTDYRYPVIGGL